MLKWSSNVILGSVRCFRYSFLHYEEKLCQYVYSSNIKLKHTSSSYTIEELQQILNLSEELIHHNTSIPFNKLKILSLERCFRFFASYFARLRKGEIRPLQTQHGIIDEHRVQSVVNLLWERAKLMNSPHSFFTSGRVYSHMIDILARSGRAVEAEDILKEMVAWTQLNSPPATRIQEKTDEYNCLHAVLFSTVINAYVKMETTSASALHERRRDRLSCGKSGLERAEALLKYQLQLYQEWNKPSKIKPNIIGFTALLDGYARKGDGLKAEALMDDLLNHGFMATTTTFNVVIAAWSRASSLESSKSIQNVDQLPARKAEQILLTMEKRSQGTASPDVVSFSTGASFPFHLSA